MLQPFKKYNPTWNEIKVCMTDKDMTERATIKLEIPQAALQICLFHVLRTFGREITIDKMGNPSGEKATILSHIQEITYSRDEDDYMGNSKMVRCAVTLDTSFAQCLNGEYRTVNKARC